MDPEGLAEAAGQRGLGDQGVPRRGSQPLRRPVGVQHAGRRDPGVLCHDEADPGRRRDPVADPRHFLVTPVTVRDRASDQGGRGGQYLVHAVEQTELKSAETELKREEERHDGIDHLR